MVYLSEGAKEAYLHYQCHRAPKLYIEKSHQEPQCFSWWQFYLQDHVSGYQQNIKEMDSACPELGSDSKPVVDNVWRQSETMITNYLHKTIDNLIVDVI